MKDEENLIQQQTADVLKTYSTGERKDLIPILQEVQARLGYLPRKAMLEIASFFGIAEGVVYGVATFYNQFRLTPPGKHVIKVCMGTACHIKGGELIQDAWERKLDTKVGSVTQDREFSLERVACVGCCALAPVVVADETVYGEVRPTKVEGIIVDLERKEGDDL
jgi:NADH-quinone oxidoreductase subunit E